MDRRVLPSKQALGLSLLVAATSAAGGLFFLGSGHPLDKPQSGGKEGLPDQNAVHLVVETARQHQKIEGFGTALVSWQPEVERYYESEAFPHLYLETLGASVLRVDLWADSVPEFEHPDNLSYKDFILDGPGRRGGFFVRFAEELNRRSKGKLKVIASAWSPGAWMKVGGTRGNGAAKGQNFSLGLSELKTNRRVYFRDDPQADPGGLLRLSPERDRFLHGNRLRPDRYAHFAKSLVEWVRLFRSHGVELFALSPQNEPRFSHWFESCSYVPEELAELTEVIIRTFAAEGERLPLLFAPETMSHDTEGNRAYLEALFRRPVVAEHLAAIASHGYVDGYKSDESPDSPGRFLDLARAYDKPVWMTEGGTGLHDWPQPLHGVGTALMNALVAGDASLVTPWQVVSRTPDAHGLATIAGPTKKTSVAAHFFRFIRPGMTRVETTAASANWLTAAFVDKGQLVLIVLNRSAQAGTANVSISSDQTYQLAQVFRTDKTHDVAALPAKDFSRTQAIPPESVTTLVYSRR